MAYVYKKRAVFALVLGLLFAGIAACAGGGASSGENPNRITREEIEETGFSGNAFQVVQRLRPNWLQRQGGTSMADPGQIVVYVEGSRQGGPDALRNIEVVNVESLEFLSAREATVEYGSGHDNGVIRVYLRE